MRTTAPNHRTAAHCSGQLAPDRYIWFGGDPIGIIALSPTPME